MFFRRFSSLINNALSNLFLKAKQEESRLRGRGHGIAAARMDAKLNVAGWIPEQMGGISYFEFIQNLEMNIDEDWEGIAHSLDEIRRSLLSREGCLINVTANGKNLTNCLKYLDKFIGLLPNTRPNETDSWQSLISPSNEAIVFPTQVNYSSSKYFLRV
ncbi:hypothetical protein ZIOFF_072823 [Zingiber officinale]|uniref:Peptidase M16C associated domain-containing protein n=1 Tax=Zingiber officinale TaxID=94328 RepID=A0A8J5C6C4_ZINOF|nr:hypothetical protein ZIOFF_072823 [Zingiber officinale]